MITKASSAKPLMRSLQFLGAICGLVGNHQDSPGKKLKKAEGLVELRLSIYPNDPKWGCPKMVHTCSYPKFCGFVVVHSNSNYSNQKADSL